MTHLYQVRDDTDCDGVQRILHVHVVVVLQVLRDLLKALNLQHMHAAGYQRLPEHLYKSEHRVGMLVEAACDDIQQRSASTGKHTDH
eukprot:6202537-Pleurochrysis_carterae.AAC.1